MFMPSEDKHAIKYVRCMTYYLEEYYVTPKRTKIV